MNCRAHQAPLSMEFSRQEYWSGLPFPPLKGSSWPRDGTQVDKSGKKSVSCHEDSYKFTSEIIKKYFYRASNFSWKIPIYIYRLHQNTIGTKNFWEAEKIEVFGTHTNISHHYKDFTYSFLISPDSDAAGISQNWLGECISKELPRCSL